jgi:PAS domain S-box-containing protein
MTDPHQHNDGIVPGLPGRKVTPVVPHPSLLLAAIVDSSDDAIVSKDLAGIITTWNKSAERIFGYGSDEAVGMPITMLLPPGLESEEQNIMARIKEGTPIDHFETTRRRKDGRIIDVSITVSPIRDESGLIIGASKVARDITEQKVSTRAALLLGAIVSSSDDAIISKNLNGIIMSWNEGAERMFGYTAVEAIGRSVLMLLPKDREPEESRILDRLRRGERVEHFETVRMRKTGEQFPVSLTISPIKDAMGTVVGASKIARDISLQMRTAKEREHLLESERTARSQAERANRMKDEFLSTVSHELRTPLNAIVGWTQVLKEVGDHRDEVREGLETIERNARVQAQLIEDLLDLGRISSGKMTLDVEWLQISAVIQDAVASVRHAAEAKHIGIKLVLNDFHSSMMGDKRRLQQSCWNLLTNAIKFTPNGGSVVVTVIRIESKVEIAVADTGSGIAADFLPHIFERFRQADSSTTRKYGGLGIGLALVKQLVDLHGGEVRAESPGIGKGSTFTILLPLVIARRESDLIRHAQPPPRTLEKIDVDELAGIKVLAVDDDPDSLEVIRRILSSRHAEVKTATSAEEALAIFPDFIPDLVLSDIGMPSVDGYELIRRLRELPLGASVPAAALTALARSEDRMQALKAGFQTHLAKPVIPAELIAVVRSLTALLSARNRDELR